MSTPSKTGKRQLTPNQQKRRQRILHAARDLVAKLGYEGTIMRDVAAAANVSPTTLYNLYNTKDDLLLEALKDSIINIWRRTSQEAAEPGFNRLLTQLHYAVEQTHEEPAYAHAITHALLRANAGNQLTEILINDSQDAVMSSLRAMQLQGQMRNNTDLIELGQVLVGALWTNYMLWSKGIFGLDALERALRRTYLSLLLPVSTESLKKEIERQLNDLLSA